MAKFTGELKISIGANTSAVEKAIKDVSKSISKFSKKINSLGKDLSVSLSDPLTALGAAATAAGLTVRNALNDVAVGTGATGEALRGLQADFKAIAGQVPDDMALSAKAISDLNTMLGVSGKDLQDIAISFLDVSRITKSDLGTNISAVTKLMNNWGIAASRADEILDKLLFTSQNTGVSIDALASGITNTGASLRAMGISVEEGMALVGQLDKAGVNAQQVIGSLQRAMGNFAKAGVKDFSSAFKSVIDSIFNAESLNVAVKNASEVFGRLAGPVLATAIRDGRLEIDEFAKSINNALGTVDTFTQETEGFGEKWGRLTNQLTLALEPLGTHILEIAEEYIPALGEATGMLNIDFSDTTIKIGMIVAALGPATVALGAFTGAVSSLVSGLAGLVGMLSGPFGLFVGLSALGVALLKYKGQIGDSKIATEQTAQAFANLSEQIRNMTMEQLKNQLVSAEGQLKSLRGEIYRVQSALASLQLQRAKIIEDNLVQSAFGGELPFTKSLDAESESLQRRLAYTQELEKGQQKYLDEIQKQIKLLEKPSSTGNNSNGGGGLPKSGKSKHSGKTGKTEVERFVENLQDRIKYLNEDGQKFLPTIEAMQAKLKPLSEDWKKLEDLRLNINTEAFSKSIQQVQDEMRYFDKNGAEYLPQLQEMLKKYKPFSEEWKRIQDVMRSVNDSIYSETWSKNAWEFSEGLLKSSDYAEMLKTEISGLEEGTAKWRARFSELQNVEMQEASKKMNLLSSDFQHGILSNSEYETALNAIMQEFSDFPRVVQAASEALEKFHRQSSLSSVSLDKQLSDALKGAKIDFQELQGKGILGTVEGFLQASIYGEDFGESLKKLGQDIVYVTLKMVTLAMVQKMVNSFFGGTALKNEFGNVFSDGHRLTAYARGGLVNKPTVFPMAHGMGLMGEAGPEAVIPLGRDSQGRLGVYGSGVSGNSAPTVIVNVENQSGIPLTAQQNGVTFDEQFNRAVVQVILRDQATNGPISRNYRSVMR